MTGVLLSATVLVKLNASGSTWYVDADPNSCDDMGSGTLQVPFCSIQRAICVAQSGDLVSVAPGTYPESLRMRPGVDVVSQAGPLQTIIDGTGKPCTETDYCTKRTGQCSTVLFGSGHTNATLLDGFTVTGGSGTIQTTNTWSVGGGIFVFSSPTISNNIITNNQLSGSQPYYFGGGLFIPGGAAVITNNVISGNKAIPGAGTSKNSTAGYGGGIYVGFYASPTITGNTIINNDAGLASTSNSVGAGGGVAIFPGDGTRPDVVVDRNVIADNYASDLGGGVHVLGLTGAVASPIITNNVIVGNHSHFEGGGIYIAYIGASFVNNTITDNAAKRGGGIESGVGNVSMPVLVTNNIIEGNRITDLGGQGGGIFSYSYASSFEPTISYNDLFGNDGNQVDGDITDAMVIGMAGNFSADPLFTDPNNRDFHIDPNSPAVDAATTAGAPASDFDQNTRGADGDGMPNSPQMGDVDMGAFEVPGSCSALPEVCDNLDNDCDGTTDNFATACGLGECASFGTCTAGADSCTPGTPAAESCDGLDNSCDGVTDEGFPDFDTDGAKDCVDPDDDNDGAADGADCAPFDAGSFGVPSEVQNLDLTMDSPTLVTWDMQNIGPATGYELLSGLLSRMVVTGGLAESYCLSASEPASPFADSRIPPLEDGFFYLMRPLNACGTATLGLNRDLPRTLGLCSSGVVDADEDGSPSDLDCNDANAAVSPLAPETCDNLDNDCDGTTDSIVTTCGVGACVSSGFCTTGSDTCVPGTPSQEICDGLDNDCDGVVDNGLPDTDLDGIPDCTDGDDDNDGAPDSQDCAPLDETAFAVPVEVTDLQASGTGPTDLTWAGQVAGQGTLYDVVTGEFSAIGSLAFTGGSCLASTTDFFTTDGGADPALNSVFYYIVKARNACGPGTFGSPQRDLSPSCP